MSSIAAVWPRVFGFLDDRYFLGTAEWIETFIVRQFKWDCIPRRLGRGNWNIDFYLRDNGPGKHYVMRNFYLSAIVGERLVRRTSIFSSKLVLRLSVYDFKRYCAASHYAELLIWFEWFKSLSELAIRNIGSMTTSRPYHMWLWLITFSSAEAPVFFSNFWIDASLRQNGGYW